jgi:hypothetical protein
VNDFEEVSVISAGKRCGVNWTPWMGDWFVSHSPRNSNSNAEGPWDHWVDLAIRILRDPMTAKVRPAAHAAAAGLEMQEFYDGANVRLDGEDLRERFTK